jgi:Ca2+-binding RTX toxin-like protein
MAGITKATVSTKISWGTTGFDASYADDTGGYIDYLNPFKTTTGTLADDFIFADWHNDTVYGRDGHDIVYGDYGNDTLHGGNGNDLLFGGADDDVLNGNNGNDYLSGDSGRDSLNGGNNNDWLYGGDDADTLNGGNGDDELYGEEGDDSLLGGSGNDTMSGGNGNDTLRGGDGFNRLFGEDGIDYIVAGNNGDILGGGADNDKLIGGASRDILAGGTGRDYLTGGSGDDVFLFAIGDSDASSAGSDVIWDFETGIDRIGILPDFPTTADRYAEFETSAGTVEQALAAASTHAAGAGDPSFAFLFNTARDIGFLVMDLDLDGAYETAIGLRGCGSADDFDAGDVTGNWGQYFDGGLLPQF